MFLQRWCSRGVMTVTGKCGCALVIWLLFWPELHYLSERGGSQGVSPAMTRKIVPLEFSGQRADTHEAVVSLRRSFFTPLLCLSLLPLPFLICFCSSLPFSCFSFSHSVSFSSSLFSFSFMFLFFPSYLSFLFFLLAFFFIRLFVPVL